MRVPSGVWALHSAPTIGSLSNFESIATLSRVHQMPMIKHREKLFAVLPTLLTLGNAACGFGAITFAAKVGPTTLGGNEVFYASLLIFFGMVFDMLDGSAARLTNQTSEFGAQLDSLCDAVTFGVAPAFLMLQFVSQYLVTRPDADVSQLFFLPARLLWVIAVLFVLCVILRLARFNVETDEEDSHEGFSGLPSPAAAGAVASFPLAMGGLVELADSEKLMKPFAQQTIPVMQLAVPLVTFCVACLMVSRIRYPHVFNQLFKGKRSRGHLIQLLFTLAAVFLIHWAALPIIFCYFAFGAPIRAGWNEYVKPRFTKPENGGMAPS